MIRETLRRIFLRHPDVPAGDQSNMSKMRDDPNFVFPGGDEGPLTEQNTMPEGGYSTRAPGSVSSKSPLPGKSGGNPGGSESAA